MIVSPVALPSPFGAPLDSMKQKSICTFGKASSFSTRAVAACGSSFPRPKTQGLHQAR